MNDTIKLDEGSTDLQELYAAIHGLIGRKCWRAAFTYGGELSLHFGRHLAYGNPKMAGKRRGEWRLDTRATPWMLFTPDGSTSSKERDKLGEQSVEQKLKVLAGRHVTGLSIGIPDRVLTIAFCNDYLFRVIPTANNAKSTLTYWKLFMPDHKLVTFGPGSVWSCRKSNMPISSAPARLRAVASHD